MGTGGTRPSLDQDSSDLRVPDFNGISNSVDATKLQLDILNCRVDTYKWQADEYRSRYEGQRTLEWNTIVQIYVGYTAIALSFNYIHSLPQFHDLHPVTWTAMAATSVFYLASRYLSYRIQERLVLFNETQENYTKQLRKWLSIHSPAPGTRSLRHPYYWTYDVQLVLNTVTFIGLITYEISSLVVINAFIGFLLVLLAAELVLIGLIWIPVHRPKPDHKTPGSSHEPSVATGGECAKA